MERKKTPKWPWVIIILIIMGVIGSFMDEEDTENKPEEITMGGFTCYESSENYINMDQYEAVEKPIKLEDIENAFGSPFKIYKRKRIEPDLHELEYETIYIYKIGRNLNNKDYIYKDVYAVFRFSMMPNNEISKAFGYGLTKKYLLKDSDDYSKLMSAMRSGDWKQE